MFDLSYDLLDALYWLHLPVMNLNDLMTSGCIEPRDGITIEFSGWKLAYNGYFIPYSSSGDVFGTS